MLSKQEFDDAVSAGVRAGFEKTWTDYCEGRDEPEERCPMRLQDGCACYYRAYHEAPWWRRSRMEKPRRPSQDAVLRAYFEQKVDDLMPDILAERRAALKAPKG
jgi:hypothetical protein